MVSPADSSPPMAILSCDDQLANVLEAHRRLVERHLVIIGQRVDQVGGGHALGHAVLPAARLHQIVEEQRDDVVGLDEGSVAVHDAEAVGIAVGGNASAAPISFIFCLASPSRWSSGSGAWPPKSTSR
jgi:hypothetical protein